MLINLILIIKSEIKKEIKINNVRKDNDKDKNRDRDKSKDN